MYWFGIDTRMHTHTHTHIYIYTHTHHLHSLYIFHCWGGGDKHLLRRMASSGMLRRVALVRTDVSEELSASIIRVTRISELGTTLAVTSNRHTKHLLSLVP
jgi:hypothetical protein